MAKWFFPDARFFPAKKLAHCKRWIWKEFENIILFPISLAAYRAFKNHFANPFEIMRKILNSNFFNRPTLEVAKELLGKYLVRKVDGNEIALLVKEVEAYDGFKDKASHASRGKTLRNEPMFGPAGYFYIYFTYGVHWMLNVVTGEKDYPAAILIRGAGDISGPARLTKFLKIDKSLNGKKMGKESGLWFEDGGIIPAKITRTPRIGVAYAGSMWANKNYRFFNSPRFDLFKDSRSNLKRNE